MQPVIDPLESRWLLAFTPFAVKINFQPAGNAPSGYIADTGATYGARNGYTYGWNVINTANTRNRNSSSSPDERFDTLNQMQKTGNTTRWELGVPNGTYRVDLAAGDPSYTDSIYRINVENVLAISGTPNSSMHWFEQTVVVSVTDGRLTLSNASGASNNKVNFVTVTRVDDATPKTTGAPVSNDFNFSGAALSDDYNFDGAKHNLAYIALNRSNAPLYDGAGHMLLGLVVNNRTISGVAQPSIRIQTMEKVTVGGKDYYYSWGLGGIDGQSGFVAASDLVSTPTIDPTARGGSGGLYNGRSAPDVLNSNGTTKSYYIDPNAIQGDMYYIGPSTGSLYHYDNYGVPADPYSLEHTYLSWSWINKKGGGIARSPVLRGEAFYPSKVATINLSSLDANKATNGSVRAIYGSFMSGTQRMYGWTVYSHTYKGVYTSHLRFRS